MYLRGLNALADDYSVDPSTGDVMMGESYPPLVVDDLPVAPPPPVNFPSLPSVTPPTSSTPWTTLAQGAMKIWSNLQTAQNAQGQPISRAALPPARAGYSPFPATGVSAFSSGVGGVLLPVAIGAGVFLIARALMKG